MSLARHIGGIVRGLLAAVVGVAVTAARAALPSGYAAVEYIQGTGVNATTPCRLLVDFCPNPQTDKIVADFMLTDTSQNAAIWCARGSGAKNSWTFWALTSLFFRYDYGTAQGSGFGSVSANVRYVATAENNRLTLSDGNSYTHAAVSGFTVTGGPLSLFASYVGDTSSSVGNYSNHRLYSFKIYRDGELLHDLQPAVDADGVATLVDVCDDPVTITRTGQFTPGTLIVDLRASVRGTYAWTGSPIVPDVLVTDTSGNVLDESEYSLVCTNNVDPGLATVKVTGYGTHAGVLALSFVISPNRAHLASFADELFYVQGDGTAYIDLGTKLSQADTVELTEMECVYQASAIFGARTDSTTVDSFICGFNDVNSLDQFVVDYRSGSTGRLLLTPVALGLRDLRLHIVDGKDLRAVYDADTGDQIGAETTSITEEMQTSSDIQLFGAAGGTWATSKFKGRIYDFRIIQNGTVRMNLLPARRRADGLVGMYDLVTASFFTNAAASGAFAAGPPVPQFAAAECPVLAETGSPVRPADIALTNICTGARLTKGVDYLLLSDGTATLGQAKLTVCGIGAYAGQTNTAPFVIRPVPQYARLPRAYRRVAYLQGDGTAARILTDYTPDSLTDRIEATVAIVTPTNPAPISCARGKVSIDGTYSLWYIADGCSLRFDYYDTTHLFAEGTVPAGVAFRVVADGAKASWSSGAEAISCAEVGFTVGGPVMMFCSYYNGTDQNLAFYSDHRLYAYRVWRNGALLRDFVPCVRRSDGAAGLYDACTRQFFGNVGGGSFRVGPDIRFGTSIVVD